jgi:hypothetical protein
MRASRNFPMFPSGPRWLSAVSIQLSANARIGKQTK